MKFNVPSKTLYNYASAVGKVINQKNALMILDNFLFSLQDNTLSITGQDVENALTATFEVLDAEGEGKFCINARKLVDLLKELPDQPISMEINDDTLEVKVVYNGAEFAMVALPADQYPQPQADGDGEDPIVFDYPSAHLVKGIENTLFAVGTDDFHPQMMGILFDITPSGITFVATDTRKLVRFCDNNGNPEVKAKCIMPQKPANILKSILSKDEEATVKVTLTSKSATFDTDNYTFNCRLIKGNYPDYNRVIPKNNPYMLSVNRGQFLNCVRRVGIFVDPGYGMEKFKITNDRIHIKSNDSNQQTAGNETIECEYTGPEIVIGFSAPYLIEICNTISSENLVIHLSDPSRPGVFYPSKNDPATELLILLMPMNVTEF